jgi:transcriptional regulator with XRE-family HTH domain
MTPGPSEADPVQERAGRLSAELRRRRLAAGLTQQALADRIRYDRSYLSQVETGTQVPAEQFILLCERELAAGGTLFGIFRELLAQREASRQQGHAERWRAGAGGQSMIERVSPIVLPTSSGRLATPADDPSNSDMERRPFFRMLGVASGAMLAETLGVGPGPRHAGIQRQRRHVGRHGDKRPAPASGAREGAANRNAVSPARAPPRRDQPPAAVAADQAATTPVLHRWAFGRASRLGDLRPCRPRGGKVVVRTGAPAGGGSRGRCAARLAPRRVEPAASYDGEPADALALIRRGQNHAARSLDASVQG